MLLLLVVESKGALVLVMLMSEDMLRHALMLEHCGWDGGRVRWWVNVQVVVGWLEIGS